MPSPTDQAEAFTGFIYLIAGPVDGGGPFSITAWELTDGNLRPLTLVTDPEEYNRLHACKSS